MDLKLKQKKSKGKQTSKQPPPNHPQKPKIKQTKSPHSNQPINQPTETPINSVVVLDLCM